MHDPFFWQVRRHFARPPAPSAGWALFLDLDGTLLDIAPEPDAVIVPPDLLKNLVKARDVLGGALAIVSGRTLASIDTLLQPLVLPASGGHGASVRAADGHVHGCDIDLPPTWLNLLREFAANDSNLLLEEKPHSVALHYRAAAWREQSCQDFCHTLVSGLEEQFQVLQGRMVVEIKPRAITKARAVEILMRTPPFAGRIPVFAGDDETDLDGMRAATALGGMGLDVLEWFAGKPSEVRKWIGAIGRLSGPGRVAA